MIPGHFRFGPCDPGDRLILLRDMAVCLSSCWRRPDAFQPEEHPGESSAPAPGSTALFLFDHRFGRLKVRPLDAH